jgi:cytochrome P450
MSASTVRSTVPPPGCPVSHAFDPFGPEYQADPAQAQAAGGPVFFSEVLGWYVVTRHEDIRTVYADTESFSSQIFSDPITPLCPAATAKLDEYGFKTMKSLGTLDEPIHLQRRRRIDEPFKHENVAGLEPRIQEVMAEAVDAFVARGHADLVADLFWDAPAIVALEFMGVPEAEIADVKENAAGVLTFIFGRPSEAEQVATCELMGRQYGYARGLIARLKEDPSGPGLLQYAVRASLTEPEYFDDHFLISLCINTLAAAHETTAGSLANTMLSLLEQPERWQALAADPGLIAGAIEECFRFSGQLTTGRRLCVKDTVVGGVPIPAGAKVLLGLSAGQRDEAMFPEPETFDPERRNAKRHFAFGYASHFCLGAPLARVQMRIVLEELARRLPHMRLVDGQRIEYTPTANSHTPKALLVEWDAAANPVPGDRP